MTECHAGRSAFFGGRWTSPCPNEGRNVIGSPSAEPIRLCDEHFEQVAGAGLVKEQNLSKADFDKREQQRVKPGRRWFRRGQG
jgi:hypothetical protein